MKRPSRRTIVILAVLALAGATWTCSACSAAYVVRAGYEEAKILAARRPIAEVIAAPGTSPEAKRRLELVLTARDFAEHALDLDAGDSYTTYTRLERDTLAMILSGARRDAFMPVTWWFPIVGSVPYKGYFDFGRARRDSILGSSHGPPFGRPTPVAAPSATIARRRGAATAGFQAGRHRSPSRFELSVGPASP